jgi:hypothetical protein
MGDLLTGAAGGAPVVMVVFIVAVLLLQAGAFAGLADEDSPRIGRVFLGLSLGAFALGIEAITVAVVTFIISRLGGA